MLPTNANSRSCGPPKMLEAVESLVAKRGRGDREIESGLERAFADPQQRLDHQREHRRLDPVEQRHHRRRMRVRRIEPGQAEDDQRAGQNEQRAGDKAAARRLAAGAGVPTVP